jgi:hypothetical protein
MNPQGAEKRPPDQSRGKHGHPTERDCAIGAQGTLK